jgi:hypothetical protein
MENYKLHDLLKSEIDRMNTRERRQFKAVLTQTLPSYIDQAAKVARIRSQNDTDIKAKTAQSD